MKILICEDQEILLTALEFRLRRIGFDVVIARDGEEALRHIKTQPFDMVVADVMMPKITGLELVQKVRSELKNKLPIIIISALENDEGVLQAIQAGANDFVAKPFKPAELVLRIKRILQTKRTSIRSSSRKTTSRV